MNLQVAKWGNSLAVRLPANMAKALSVSEGSVLHAEVLGLKMLRIVPRSKPPGRGAFVAGLRALHQQVPVTQPIARDDLDRY